MTKKLLRKKKHTIWCVDTTSCIQDEISFGRWRGRTTSHVPPKSPSVIWTLCIPDHPSPTELESCQVTGDFSSRSHQQDSR